MQFLMRLLLLTAVVALVLPFLITSLLLDRKGLLVRGQVIDKDEWITVGYSSWTRHAQAQVKYSPPDESGVAFLNVNLEEEQFDQLRKGDAVELRYLLAKDLPDWPGMKTMRQMHLLPMVRLAVQRTGSQLGAAVRQKQHAVIIVVSAFILLVIWRWVRLPFFPWVVAVCLLVAMIGSTAASFPKPTPAPSHDVKTATGMVKSVEYWKQLFDSSQNRSTIRWIADQPIAVVGVEFMPEGRSEPVVAVDLIDEGSISGLAQNTRVRVDYENHEPRVAHMRGAQRQFARKNLKGVLEQGAELVLVALVLWGGTQVAGQFIKKLGQAKS